MKKVFKKTASALCITGGFIYRKHFPPLFPVYFARDFYGNKNVLFTKSIDQRSYFFKGISSLALKTLVSSLHVQMAF